MKIEYENDNKLITVNKFTKIYKKYKGVWDASFLSQKIHFISWLVKMVQVKQQY